MKSIINISSKIKNAIILLLALVSTEAYSQRIEIEQFVFTNDVSFYREIQATGGINAGTFGFTGATVSADAITGGTLIVHGNVGIGITNPSAPLMISVGTAGNDTLLKLDQKNGFLAGGTALIRAGRGSVGAEAASTLFGYDYDSDGFQVRKGADGTGLLTVKNTGNVGIGTNAPIARVHIVTPAVSGAQNMYDIDRTSASMIRITNPNYSTDSSVGILLRSFPDSDLRQGAGIISSGGTANGDSDLDLFVSSGSASSVSSSQLKIKGNTGYVGIGTNAPEQKLHVSSKVVIGTSDAIAPPATSGTAQSGPFRISNTSKAGIEMGLYNASPYAAWIQGQNFADMSMTQPLVLNPLGGNVGIGTVSPAATLEVHPANDNTNAFRVYRGRDSGYQFDYLNIDVVAGGGNDVRFRASRNADLGGNNLGMVFNVTGTDVVYMANNGNVGIGTNVPAAKLHVAGDVQLGDSDGALRPTIKIIGETANGASENITAAIQVGAQRYDYVGADDNINFLFGRTRLSSSYSGRFSIYANNRNGSDPNSTTNEVFSILKSGNIGIGTTNPDTKLQVISGESSSGIEVADSSGGARKRMVMAVDSTAGFLDAYNVGSGALPLKIQPNGGNSIFGGSVGINTNTVGYATPLTVKGTVAGAGRVAVFGNATNDNVIVLGANNDKAYIESTYNTGAGYKPIAFVTTAAERMRIDENGNVAIGTTNTLNTRFKVRWNEGGTDPIEAVSSVIVGDNCTVASGSAVLAVKNAGNRGTKGHEAGSALFKADFSDATAMIIDKNGNVGIGTNAPANALHIHNASAAQLLVAGYSPSSGRTNVDSGAINLGSIAGYHGALDYDADGNTIFKIDNTYDHVGAKIKIRMRTTGTPVDAITVLGSGNVGIGTSTPVKNLVVSKAGAEGVEFEVGSEGNLNDTIHYNRDTSIYITNRLVADTHVFLAGSPVPSERMRIGANGYVGIGTANPLASLNISNASAPRLLLNLGTNQADLYIGGGFTEWEGSTRRLELRAGYTPDMYEPISISGHGIEFKPTGDASTPKMVLASSGNVGIGTTAPKTNLNIYSYNDDVTAMLEGNLAANKASVDFKTIAGNAYVVSKIVGAGEVHNDAGYLAFHTRHYDNGLLERMRINYNGNVGIGTSTPDVRLQVQTPSASSVQRAIRLSNPTALGDNVGVDIHGECANLDLGTIRFTQNGSALQRVEISGANDGTGVGLSVVAGGNVGIGTNNPGYKLEVNGDSLFTDKMLIAVPSNVPTIFRFYNGYGNNEVITFKGNGSAANRSMGLRFAQSSDSSLTIAEGAYNANDDVSTGWNDLMTVKSSGNVGIGITSPTAKLHVLSADANPSILSLVGTNEDANAINMYMNKLSASPADSDEIARIYMQGKNDVGTLREYVLQRSIIDDVTDGTEDSSYETLTYKNGVQTSTLMLKSGNVGIGTANPTAKLYVSGDTQIDGNFKFGASSYQLWWTNTTEQADSRSYGFVGEQGVYGRFELRSSDASDGVLDRSVIAVDKDGNVGIGTNAPSSPLHVKVASGGEVRIVSANTWGGLLGYDTGSVQKWRFAYDSTAFLLGTVTNVPLVFQANDTEWMRIADTGNVGIGTNNPSHLLHLKGGAYCDGTGDWIAGSDIKWKKDITPLSTNKYGIDTVLKMNPVTYVHKNDTNNTVQLGFIAQELKPIIPEVVTGKEGDYGIAYSRIAPVLVNAIKEQNAMIKQQNEMIKDLQKRLEALENKK